MSLLLRPDKVASNFEPGNCRKLFISNNELSADEGCIVIGKNVQTKKLQKLNEKNKLYIIAPSFT